MGGRSGRTATEILGSSNQATTNKRNIQRKLNDGTQRVVAETVLEAVATTNPTVAIIYCAYEAAKFTYPIVEKGFETYDKTGDKDKAVEKMKEETVNQVGKKVVETAVETIVNTAWDGTKNAMNLSTNNITDTIITTAISKTINEVIRNE